jgi:hypothetical protein
MIRMIKSRRTRWAGHVARIGEKMNAYRILVVKPEGKRSIGRPKYRWVDNNYIDFGDRTGLYDWIDLAQDMDRWRVLANKILNFRVPYNTEKSLSSCRTGGFSRRAQLHEIS